MSSESLESIEALAGHLADGSVTPAVGHRFDLDAVPTAIEAMEAGTLTTKAIIRVRS